MIVDFHTHVFPDKIAEKTIAYLSAKGGIPPFSDGTVTGLRRRMEEAGVSLAVTLPVLTNPDSFESVNRFALSINEARQGLLSFGAIHPRCTDIAGKMQALHDMGFLGVKLHPDYQETFIDDEGYAAILSAAKRHGMIVVAHAGVDVGYPDSPVRCTPDRVLALLRRVPYDRLVLAHMGGCLMADEVLRRLCGKDIWFDTAYVLRTIGRETFCRLAERHGTDKILFGSDSPWSPMAEDVATLKALVPDEKAQGDILYRNAHRLLGF